MIENIWQEEMVNLNIYDDVAVINTNWFDPKYKRFYSKVIPKKKFFCILKRYDNVKRENNYYIALSDIEDSSHIWGVVQSSSNYTKYDLKDIWNTLPVHNYTGVTEVNIELIEQDDESLLYYLDI